MNLIDKISISFSKLLRKSINEEIERKYNDVQQENQEYVKYVNEHISNVNKVWQSLYRHVDGKFGIEFWIEDCEFFEIDSRIKSHDESKFSNYEFYGYAQWFYPRKEYHRNENIFTDSWNHHQKANDHHWQYWLMYENSKTIALSMPYACMIEMLCDWGAMSLKFNNRPSEWYEKEKDNMLMHETTKSFVKRWLPKLDSAVEIAGKS